MFKQYDLPMESSIAKQFVQDHFPSRDVIQIPITRSMKRGQCYGNVNEVVRDEGGSVQYAWVLSWIPGILVEALHHALWRNPAGFLEDVTKPAFSGMSTDHVAVVLDNETQPEKWEPAVPSKFRQLDTEDVTARFISAVTLTISARNDLKNRLNLIRFEVVNGKVYLPHYDLVANQFAARLQTATKERKQAVLDFFAYRRKIGV